MIDDGTIDSTASAVPDGVAELSSQNASMYIDSMQPSVGTPGAASISSPNTLGQSHHDALPSSPESSMEQPLLNTDSVSVRTIAKAANS